MSRALPLHQWPAEQRAHIAGVITDIDDTLTEGGHLMAQARSALQELADAGVPVIAVTGRPVGWSLRCLGGPGALGQAPWPLLGVVAENGAVALWRGPDGQVLRRYRADSATRQANRQRLQAALAAVEQALPQARRAQDSEGRETDIAIDHSEFHHLSAAQIEQVIELLRGHGLRVSVSSIHINAWLGDHDKWVGACWAVEHWLDQQLSEQLAHWVYIGDSSNDEVMFEHMQHSAGVANIARFLDRLEHAPSYLCAQARGAGFAELASALLQARAARPR
jgi:HAD superfamily hydrolase (TIGR01484 family)